MQEVFTPEPSVELKDEYDGFMPRTAKFSRSEVGQRLASLRQAKGLTQKQLAKSVGVSQQDIAYWERQAATPRGDVLPKLALILEVSIDELLGIRPVKSRREGPKGKLHQVFEAASQLPRRQQEKIVELVKMFVSQYSNGKAA